MGRDIFAWIDYDEHPRWKPKWRELRAETFAKVEIDRESRLFDLLAGAGRTYTLAEALEEARSYDPEGVERHLQTCPPLFTLTPKRLPPRLGFGPEDALVDIGFAKPDGRYKQLFGTRRRSDDYHYGERPFYFWPPKDPAYHSFSWLSRQELAEVADRYAAVPRTYYGRVTYEFRHGPLDAAVAAMASLDANGYESRFVFWFGD